MMTGLPPLAIPPNLEILHWVISLPFWLGIISSPGYIYVVFFTHKKKKPIPTIVRRWIIFSLWLGCIASMWGAIISCLIPPVALLSFLSALLCIYILFCEKWVEIKKSK